MTGDPRWPHFVGTAVVPEFGGLVMVWQAEIVEGEVVWEFVFRDDPE